MGFDEGDPLGRRSLILTAITAVAGVLIWLALDGQPSDSGLIGVESVFAREPELVRPEPPPAARLVDGSETVDPALRSSVGASLVVKLSEQASGRPLSGMRLVIYEPGSQARSRAVPGHSGAIGRDPTTDPNGVARFEVPAGVSLRVAARGVQGASFAVDPLAPGEARSLTLELPREVRPVLHGQLIDATSFAPIAEAELRLLRTGGRSGLRAWAAPESPVATSDTTGHFAFELPTGAGALVQVDAVGYGPSIFSATGGTRAEDPRVIGLARESILEVTASGAEAAGLTVRAHIPATALLADAGSQSTDLGDVAFVWIARAADDGRATLRHLPAGVPLELELESAGRVVHTSAEPITLDPGVTRELHIELGLGTTLTGFLRESNGSTIAGQELWLVPALERGPGLFAGERARDSVAARTRTDADGAFRLDSVAEGDWWLGPAPADAWSNAQELGSAPAPVGRWLHVPADAGELEVSLVAERALTLEGVVRDADGRPVPFASLHYRPLRSGLSVEASTGPEGRFRLGPLFAGPFELYVAPDELAGHAGSARALLMAGDKRVELEVQ